MDEKEFQQATRMVSSFIVDYLENVADKEVLPSVSPGYLENLVEDECPNVGANFETIFREFQEKIMPGVTHWASPHFHAYYLSGNSFPSMLAEQLIAGINNVGINWESSPALAELEVVVLNWLGKMMNLPEEFLNCFKGSGGGVLQNISSECTLNSLLAAKNRKLRP